MRRHKYRRQSGEMLRNISWRDDAKAQIRLQLAGKNRCDNCKAIYDVSSVTTTGWRLPLFNTPLLYVRIKIFTLHNAKRMQNRSHRFAVNSAFLRPSPSTPPRATAFMPGHLPMDGIFTEKYPLRLVRFPKNPTISAIAPPRGACDSDTIIGRPLSILGSE